MALRIFDHPKRRIADDDIDLGLRFVSQGVGLSELAKASGLEFSPAIWI
ncbi:hypothetical protein ACQ4N7_29135 [Nodosilinea sp. AN01ver1]